MIKKARVAVLISGRGSNLKSLIDAAKNPDFPASIELVISNKIDAFGIEIAKQNGIATSIISSKEFKEKKEFEEKIHSEILLYKCDIICLAGFMRILTRWFISKWENRILNIHPSLLPSFKGGDAVSDAIKYGVKISGCSVHLVTEEVDSGKILRQSAVKVLDEDTKDTLAKRILIEEHKIYPQALADYCLSQKISY